LKDSNVLDTLLFAKKYSYDQYKKQMLLEAAIACLSELFNYGISNKANTDIKKT
jgi:hypothetical protein